MRLPHTNHEPCCIAKKPSAAMMDGGGRRRLHCLPVEAVFGRSPLGTTSSKVEPAALAGPPAGPAFFRVRRRGQDTSRLGLPRYRRVEGSSRARTAWPALRRPQRDPNSYWFADMSLCRTIDAARMVVGRGSERAEGEPPNLREPGHLARGYVMHCGCDRKLLGVNELLENWTALGQARRTAPSRTPATHPGLDPGGVEGDPGPSARTRREATPNLAFRRGSAGERRVSLDAYAPAAPLRIIIGITHNIIIA